MSGFDTYLLIISKNTDFTDVYLNLLLIFFHKKQILLYTLNLTYSLCYRRFFNYEIGDKFLLFLENDPQVVVSRRMKSQVETAAIF